MFKCWIVIRKYKILVRFLKKKERGFFMWLRRVISCLFVGEDLVRKFNIVLCDWELEAIDLFVFV